MMYKTKLFFRCIILNGFKNRLRTILSVIGLFIGVFFFSYTNILIESFYNAKMEEIKDMPENTAIIYRYAEFEQKDYELLNNAGSVKPSFGVCSKETYAIKEKTLENDVQINIRANIVGLNDYEESLITIENDNLHIIKNKLIKGNFISTKDNTMENHVVVIDEILAKMLFPNDDAIGKTIRIKKLSGAVMDGDNLDVELEIIGIIESNYYLKSAEEKLKKEVIDGKEKIYAYNSVIYVSESVLNSIMDSGGFSYALWNYETKEDYSKDRNDIRLEAELGDLSFGFGNFLDSIVEENKIKEEIQEYKFVIITITVIMLLFSGLNNMNIFFFSVKERIHEIGIRKTFGATRTDIMFQFICEGVFVGLIASVLAILVSYILGILSINLIWTFFDIKLIFKISISSIMLPMMVGLLQSIVFAMIPSFYGSKILITESLRFE